MYQTQLPYCSGQSLFKIKSVVKNQYMLDLSDLDQDLRNYV